MKKISNEQIQPLLLELLKVFAEYCKKNNIKFYLAGGTLLGAIRHKGFIPWDDDIDLFIKVDEYKNLMSLFEKNPYLDEDKRYKALMPGKVPSVYPFIKVVDTKTLVYERNVEKKYATGLWLDVFCMSYWPNEESEVKKILIKQKMYTELNKLAICGNLYQLKYKLLYPIAVPFKKVMLLMGYDSSYWCRKMYELTEYEKTNYIGNLSWTCGIRDRYLASYYEDEVEVEFEGLTLVAPKEYDKVLTQFYGEYMQLPPEEKRVRHDFDAYWYEE